MTSKKKIDKNYTVTEQDVLSSNAQYLSAPNSFTIHVIILLKVNITLSQPP